MGKFIQGTQINFKNQNKNFIVQGKASFDLKSINDFRTPRINNQ